MLSQMLNQVIISEGTIQRGLPFTPGTAKAALYPPAPLASIMRYDSLRKELPLEVAHLRNIIRHAPQQRSALVLA